MVDAAAPLKPGGVLKANFFLIITGGFMSSETELRGALAVMRAAYGRLHDMLSDCIERGVINADNLPDDYMALVEWLETACNPADMRAAEALKQTGAP